MSETAYNVAFSGFAFGPEKRAICGRGECPCREGKEETVEHTFKDCRRSRLLWNKVIDAWRETTGETKMKSTDGRVILLGDRASHWLDETEEAEFAGLAEPWAVLHKVTLHAIKEERDRDAAPRARPRRSAAQLLQKVANQMQRLANSRWCDAVAAKRQDGGRRMAAFRKKWEGG